jgi:hypothetical protein
LEPLQEALKADAERRILLYHGARAEAERVARQFPGLFQLILCAHAGDRPDPGTLVGGTRIAGPGADGKHLALASAGAAPTLTSITLGPEYGDNVGAAQIHRAYLDRVTAEDLLASVPRTPLRPGEGFAGSAACMGCHGEAHGRWRETAHSRALETLVVRGHGRDPECVGCHVVGLAQAGGFTSREKTPELASVGCESCHGPAARHARDGKTPPARAGAGSCARCHVPEHSPGFDFTRYWERIRH